MHVPTSVAVPPPAPLPLIKRHEVGVNHYAYLTQQHVAQAQAHAVQLQREAAASARVLKQAAASVASVGIRAPADEGKPSAEQERVQRTDEPSNSEPTNSEPSNSETRHPPPTHAAGAPHAPAAEQAQHTQPPYGLSPYEWAMHLSTVTLADPAPSHALPGQRAPVDHLEALSKAALEAPLPWAVKPASAGDSGRHAAALLNASAASPAAASQQPKRRYVHDPRLYSRAPDPEQSPIQGATGTKQLTNAPAEHHASPPTPQHDPTSPWTHPPRLRTWQRDPWCQRQDPRRLLSAVVYIDPAELEPGSALPGPALPGSVASAHAPGAPSSSSPRGALPT